MKCGTHQSCPSATHRMFPSSQLLLRLHRLLVEPLCASWVAGFKVNPSSAASAWRLSLASMSVATSSASDRKTLVLVLR